MIVLEENARLIATDSGGVQREAYFLGVPCLTLREETEWTETVAAGWNRLVGADAGRIVSAWGAFEPPPQRPPIFGDGDAGSRIARILTEQDVRFGRPRTGSGAATEGGLMERERSA
jgi:UDP-N-acetylglucosamine 2-epimerase